MLLVVLSLFIRQDDRKKGDKVAVIISEYPVDDRLGAKVPAVSHD